MSFEWPHHLDTIANRARNILKTGLWADCTFVVGLGENRKSFKAHRLILSMASPVFDKMFNGLLKDDPNNIEVVDIQPEAFSALLEYVYSDEINIQSFDHACELCYVAKKYMLPFLVQRCITYIWKDTNYTNACRAYEFAKLFDQNDVAKDCKRIIRTKTSRVIEHPSFKEIEKRTLLMILEQNKLNIKSENQLYEATKGWLEAEFQRKEAKTDEEKQTIFDEVITKIRFLSFHPQEFAEGPAVSSFITKDDSYAILINLVSPSPPIPFPSKFSKQKRIFAEEHEQINFYIAKNSF